MHILANDALTAGASDKDDTVVTRSKAPPDKNISIDKQIALFSVLKPHVTTLNMVCVGILAHNDSNQLSQMIIIQNPNMNCKRIRFWWPQQTCD